MTTQMYRRDHAWQYGSLKTSRYATLAGANFSAKDDGSNTDKNLRVGQSTKLIKGAPNEVWFSLRGSMGNQGGALFGSTAKSPHWNLWLIRYFM